MQLVGNEIPDMIFTDPPYNYDRLNEKKADSEYIKKMKAQGKDISLACGNKRLKDINEEGFDKLTLDKLEYLFKKNIGSIYCCCCNDLFDYIKLADKYKYKFRVHVWCKTSCTPIHNNNYLNNMEYIVFYYNSNRIFNNDLDFYYYSQFNYDNKLDLEEEQYKKLFYSPYIYLSVNEVVKDAKEAKSEHPTVKPLKLIIPKIAISSREGGLVVDMFSGSGSTLIACEKLNRRCYTVEYAPEYCNETIARWEALTGEKAVKLDNYLEEADVNERNTQTSRGI
jgi:DNA modification methylase